MNKGECSKCGKTVIASTINDGVCLACLQPEEKSKTYRKIMLAIPKIIMEHPLQRFMQQLLLF